MRQRRLAALAVGAIVLSVLAFSIATRRQLGRIGGLTDEWIMLGANLAVHGTLGLERDPWLLRPPGYPAFLAVPLWLAGPPRVVTVRYLDAVEPLVAAWQAAALATAAALLLLWLARNLRLPQAAAAALVFALNPMSVALVGVMHYDVLHMLAIVAGLWLLERALDGWPTERLAVVLAGLAWGLATLVRPLTLLLPPFVFFAFALRRPRPSLGSALAATLLFCASMATAIAPWTARNYAVSGRLVPVNLQGWANLWGMTVRELPRDPDVYRWYGLREDLLDVQARVTGHREYSLAEYVANNAREEQVYREEALANLARQPGVFARNALGNLRALTLDVSTVLLPAFRRLQGGARLSVDWFAPGGVSRLGSQGLRQGFRALVLALTALAVAGLLVAAAVRSGPAWPTAWVVLCILAAHVVTHMEFTYYYVKLPLLVPLAFTGAARIGRRPVAFGRGRVVIADLLAVALAMSAVALTIALLW